MKRSTSPDHPPPHITPAKLRDCEEQWRRERLLEVEEELKAVFEAGQRERLLEVEEEVKAEARKLFSLR